MVKIDLVTGFLGAGKTTFLKKYAKYLLSKGENIGKRFWSSKCRYDAPCGSDGGSL